VKEVKNPVALISGRLTSVDALRGLVMVVMALDHTRDFLQDMSIDATNVASTTGPLFFTRWITHFCAPLFVFLAGASAYLMQALGKKRSLGELSSFLGVRGLLLMILELTVVRLGLFSSWSLNGMFLQVIWVIGLSMMILGMLVGLHVPPRWIGLLGSLIVLGHNVLDLGGEPMVLGVQGQSAPRSWLFTMALRPGPIPLAQGVTWFVAYPLLPWFGIMALGYAFGEVLVRERWSRARCTAALGLMATVAFLLLRVRGEYGDPVPFQTQDAAIKTVMAFLNCQKYPPSLLFVLMTLGPGLLLLAGLDATEGEIAVHRRRAGGLRRALVTLGRVPLFYYILQWPVIRLLTRLVNKWSGEHVGWFSPPFNSPPGHGHGLPLVYLSWVLVVAILYLPCRCFARLKRQTSDHAWLSYW
jgi:uncharacterized membrane protein